MPPRRVARCLASALAALLCGLAPAARTAAEQAGPTTADQPALQVHFPDRALLLDITRAGARLAAAGVHGVIITSDDAGATWTQAPSPVSSILTCITFADAQRGWAAGHEGVILGTLDGGRTWSRVTAPTTTEDSFLDLLALPDGRVLAGGAYGLYFLSRDAGATWERHPALDEDMHINRLTAGASGTLYLAAEAGTLASSGDGGETWEPLEVPYEGSFYGLHELASGRLLAHGLRGHVFVSDDRGATWTPAAIDFNGLLATAAEVAPGTIVLSGAGGRIFLSRDGGTTFSMGPASGLTATAELIGSPASVVCVGDAGVRTIPLPQP
ncbi:MAG: hypothetical protein IAE82_19505 [Opitutaceae bacterium]|nr:hypothetical protein [Opitutaceae bacterium]